jgi:hypothetical protein
MATTRIESRRAARMEPDGFRRLLAAVIAALSLGGWIYALSTPGMA